jgi:hypothetical protein
MNNEWTYTDGSAHAITIRLAEKKERSRPYQVYTQYEEPRLLISAPEMVSVSVDELLRLVEAVTGERIRQTDARPPAGLPWPPPELAS